MGLTGVAMCYNMFDLTESNVFDVVFSCLLMSSQVSVPRVSRHVTDSVALWQQQLARGSASSWRPGHQKTCGTCGSRCWKR